MAVRVGCWSERAQVCLGDRKHSGLTLSLRPFLGVLRAGAAALPSLSWFELNSLLNAQRNFLPV
jgi:hypothetical protein